MCLCLFVFGAPAQRKLFIHQVPPCAGPAIGGLGFHVSFFFRDTRILWLYSWDLVVDGIFRNQTVSLLVCLERFGKGFCFGKKELRFFFAKKYNYIP